MPRWKQVLCATALLATVVGGIWMLTGGTHPIGQGGGGSGVGSTSLVPGQSTGSGGMAPGSESDPASRGMFRLGFSFIAGFCLGTFLRATLKVATIAIGFWLFLTFLLAYFDLVHVDWQAIDQLWNRFAGHVSQEWGSFQSFVTGSLPAAGLAGLGLFTGFKR